MSINSWSVPVYGFQTNHPDPYSSHSPSTALEVYRTTQLSHVHHGAYTYKAGNMILYLNSIYIVKKLNSKLIVNPTGFHCSTIRGTSEKLSTMT